MARETRRLAYDLRPAATTVQHQGFVGYDRMNQAQSHEELNHNDDAPDTHCSITLNPPAAQWPDLIHAFGTPLRTRALAAQVQLTRQSLGLPVDRPVVMAGHQPGFWHVGILAKWLSTLLVAARTGAHPAWVVVDQSPGAGSRMAYPTKEREHLARHEIALGDVMLAPAAAPAIDPAAIPIPHDTASPAIAHSLGAIFDTLAAHTNAPNLAIQLTRAAADLFAHAPWLESCRRSMHLVYASELHTTPAFAMLLDAMRAEPHRCAALYNEAVEMHANAGVRPLTIAGDTAPVELPLWERTDPPSAPNTPPTPWRRMTSDRLADVPNDRLVLRGLPMTGLLRTFACDLFIHGTGGGSSHSSQGYDRITETWFANWLGEGFNSKNTYADNAVSDTTSSNTPPTSSSLLAPAVVATATLHLTPRQLGFPADQHIPTPEQIARAWETYHRACHTPRLLGDEQAQQAKNAILEQIQSLPRKSSERLTLYKQMHALLGKARAEHATALTSYAAHAEMLQAQHRAAAVMTDRTWPWPMHEASNLETLLCCLASRHDVPSSCCAQR